MHVNYKKCIAENGILYNYFTFRIGYNIGDLRTIELVDNIRN